ncbi:MAG: hypothetical protein WAU68_05115 [Vitreimonas sp.]
MTEPPTPRSEPIGQSPSARSRQGADQARIPASAKSDDLAAPKTDDTQAIAPLAGADRSGLGAKGWSEAPEDRIGGHPELEIAPKSGPDGGLNGPQPETDPKTGAPKATG